MRPHGKAKSKLNLKITLALILWALAGNTWSGCTHKDANREAHSGTNEGTSAADNAQPSASPDPIRLGSPLFVFEPSQVKELTIVHNDPSGGDPWNARLERDGRQWRIAAGPDGIPILDRLADEKLVFHLLDTLRSLMAQSWAPEGPPSGFGLDPPSIALRWRETLSFDLELGDIARQSSQEAAEEAADPHSISAQSIPGEGEKIAIREIGRYARARNQAQGRILVVRGAALQMVDYLAQFVQIRHRVLLDFEPADLDEIEVARMGPSHSPTKVFYAHRDPNRPGVSTGASAEVSMQAWIDRARRPSPAKLGPFLEALFHARIAEFVDTLSPGELSTKIKAIEKNAIDRLRFKDRNGKPSELLIAPLDGKIWAILTSRSEAPFILYPQSLKLFEF